MKYEYKIINANRHKDKPTVYNLEQPSEWRFVAVIGDDLLMEKAVDDTQIKLNDLKDNGTLTLK